MAFLVSGGRLKTRDSLKQKNADFTIKFYKKIGKRLFKLAILFIDLFFKLADHNGCYCTCNSADSQPYTTTCLSLSNVPIFIKAVYLFIFNQILLCFKSASRSQRGHISDPLRSSEEFDHSFSSLWTQNWSPVIFFIIKS